jgi:hypothetical protein
LGDSVDTIEPVRFYSAETTFGMTVDLINMKVKTIVFVIPYFSPKSFEILKF